MKPLTDWHELAARTANEQDPDKIVDLARELIRALDMDTMKQMQGNNSEEKADHKNVPN